MAQRDLRRVRRAVDKLEKSRVELRDAIVAANESGESVRGIARCAGLSPSRIQELLVEGREARREGGPPGG